MSQEFLVLQNHISGDYTVGKFTTLWSNFLMPLAQDGCNSAGRNVYPEGTSKSQWTWLRINSLTSLILLLGNLAHASHFSVLSFRHSNRNSNFSNDRRCSSMSWESWSCAEHRSLLRAAFINIFTWCWMCPLVIHSRRKWVCRGLLWYPKLKSMSLDLTKWSAYCPWAFCWEARTKFSILGN